MRHLRHRALLLVSSLLLSSLLGSTLFPLTNLISYAENNTAPQSTAAVKKAPAKKAVAKKPAKPVAAAKPINKASYEAVESLTIVKSPEQWMGKKVTFTGIFNSFDAYALDYKPAFRDSKDYVSVLIRRPDTPAHTIPLSELKMLFPRAKSKTVRDLEPGDKVEIYGKVFSTALGDPWLELDEVSILEKTPNSKLKKGESSNNGLED